VKKVFVAPALKEEADLGKLTRQPAVSDTDFSV
jgi:hypothetical protein